MKPKTKEEKKIIEWKLKPIEFKKIKIFTPIGYKTKKDITCMFCGKSFKSGNKCPHCNLKLSIIETRKQIYEKEKYVEVIETKDDYQIIRHFYAALRTKKGHEPYFVVEEVVRWIITPKNIIKLLAIASSGVYYYFRWILESGLEFRNKAGYLYSEKYRIRPDVSYKKPKFVDRFKYCQYSHKFRFTTIDYFEMYIKYPELEMIVKKKQIYLLNAIIKNGFNISAYKKEIIVAIKNNYIIPDVLIWKDYIDNLKYFNKDTSNPKYVCPNNLQKEHKKLIDKKDRIILEEDNIAYQKRISKFKSILLQNDEINISVIKDLFQMKHEGNLLGHCVFSNGYWKKEKSLILSARYNDEVVETIEIDLEKKSLLQARGKANQPSKYHEKIITLVNNNIKEIIACRG